MNKVTKPLEHEKPTKESSIAERIRWLRTSRGMEQEKLASEIGVTRKTINVYEGEKNKKGIPTDIIIKIAKVFNVTTDYLLGLTDLESTDITYKKIHKVIGLTDDAISVLQEYNTIYEGQVLIPVLNFLISQEKLPLYETKYENWSNKADNTKWDKKKKEQFQNIVNEHYEKADEEWKNKNYIPIISMIEYFYNLKVKDEKIYMVDETIRKFFGDKKIEKLFPESIISNEIVADNVYIIEINKQLKKSKQKYKKRKGK